jgi:PIN domain nuclease of toxin-antitoxin system
LDTHAFLWFVLDDPKLTPPARRAIESASNEVCISPASYKIAIKVSLGKYRLNGSFEGFWGYRLAKERHRRAADRSPSRGEAGHYAVPS